MKYQMTLDNKEFAVEVAEKGQSTFLVKVNGVEYRVSDFTKISPESMERSCADIPVPSPPAVRADFSLYAPMPGLILEIFVKVGDTVKKGDKVIKMEAMKMSNEIVSPVAGRILSQSIKRGDKVKQDDLLLVITPSA